MFKDVTDRRLIAETVATTKHMTDFLTRMNEPLDRSSRRRWRTRFRRWGIDTSQWVNSSGRKYSDEVLARAVAESESYAAVIRTLGLRQAGGTQAHIARRIRAAAIDTSHFKRQAHNRGKPSPFRRHPELVLRVLPSGSGRVKPPQLRRALMAVGVQEQCDECGCGPEWRGRPLRLVIDHENGDWMDNRQENLRFLCPNCHAQTATWCRTFASRPPKIDG
jgi:hypothetical protein